MQPSTLRAQRPRHDDASQINPWFAFHVMVKYDNQYYDPSYGLSDVGDTFLEFTPGDKDLAPVGNFRGPEDVDRNNNGVIDVTTKKQGDRPTFDAAWIARKNVTQP